MVTAMRPAEPSGVALRVVPAAQCFVRSALAQVATQSRQRGEHQGDARQDTRPAQCPEPHPGLSRKGTHQEREVKAEAHASTQGALLKRLEQES